MKKFLLIIIALCTILLHPSLIKSQTEYSNRIAENIVQLEPVSYNNHINNLFGLTHQKDLPSLFSKNILIENIVSSVPTLETGNLIYLDTPTTKKIPESYGDSDLAVIENNNQVRYYYSKFSADRKLSLFSFREIREPMELGKTNFASSIYKSYSLKVNKGDLFLNPLLFLKATQVDNREKKFIIGSVLLESGIFIRFIDSERTIKIPLRKDFNIYVYAYEQPLKTYQKALPRSIKVTITDAKSQATVFDQIVNFSNIQKNKINNQFTVEEIYRKYNTIKMLKIGNWSEKDRLSTYIVSVKATSFYGTEDTMTFSLEFY